MPRPRLDHVRKAQILSAAAGVLSERGYANTRVVDIATAAGTSPAAILYWFDGKDGYQAITEEFFGQLAPISARKPYMASPGNHEASRYCSPMIKTLTPHVLTYGDVSLPGDPPHQPTLSRWPKEL